MQEFYFKNGMTVSDLKKIMSEWPENDDDGEPCEVWICDDKGLSNQVRTATPLNMRRSKNGEKVWADLLLESE